MRLPVATVWLASAVILVSSTDGQLFSSSRFSSSGLVFPGPPATGHRRKGNEDVPSTRLNADSVPFNAPSPQRSRPIHPVQQHSRQDIPSSNFRPSNPRPNLQERIIPPVPLSLIGQQPEEFVAAAQQRQLQQQQQLAQQPQPTAKPVSEQAEDEEEEEEPKQPEQVFRAQVRPQPQQRRPEQERPVQRRQHQDVQKPEPSIQQTFQQRRPNYPADYKPKPQKGNVLDDTRRPPNQSEDDILEEEEEEEPPKPDKLQLLLQKTDFSCSDKKDGYYADDEVDCEIFHYCQDRTRHSWLCPDGASFHQVHLICMPATADNICKKSSQFHFVNDYLYRTVDNEDGSNSSGIYADRYYPDGYEHGVPFDMSEVVHDQPNYQPFNRRQASIAQRERDQYRGQGRPHNRERYPNENRRRVDPRPHKFADDSDDDSSFNEPAFRRRQDAFDRRDRPTLEADIHEETDD